MPNDNSKAGAATKREGLAPAKTACCTARKRGARPSNSSLRPPHMKTVVSALKHARGRPVIQSARHFATLLSLLVMPNAWAGNASELLNDPKEAYAHKVSTGYARDSRLAGEAKRRELLAARRGDKEAEARARLSPACSTQQATMPPSGESAVKTSLGLPPLTFTVQTTSQCGARVKENRVDRSVVVGGILEFGKFRENVERTVENAGGEFCTRCCDLGEQAPWCGGCRCKSLR